jgi:hypothetical protein
MRVLPYPIASFKHWDVVAISISMAVLIGFELLGVFTDKGYATITAMIKDFVPEWAQAMIWGWLFFHFFIQKPKGQ